MGKGTAHSYHGNLVFNFVVPAGKNLQLVDVLEQLRLAVKILVMDLFNGNWALKKGQTIPHQKITFFPMFCPFKPSIMFFTLTFKIR